MGILGAMVFVRYGLEPLVKSLRTVFKASGAWEKSSEYHFLREVRIPAPGRRAWHPDANAKLRSWVCKCQA